MSSQFPLAGSGFDARHFAIACRHVSALLNCSWMQQIGNATKLDCLWPGAQNAQAKRFVMIDSFE
jgi:hypothetical protein